MSQDWCDLCELPLAQCPHGAPPPAPTPAAAPRRRTTSSSPAPSSGPRRPSTSVTSKAPAAARSPRTPPGRTPQVDFRRHLLAVLVEHPVAVDRDDVLADLERRMPLTAQDRGITADGEVRWRRAALKERAAMADEGLMAPAGHGLWLLSAAGRDAAPSEEDDASDSETD